MLMVTFVVADENLYYNYIEDNSYSNIENRAKPKIKREIRKKSVTKQIQQNINDRKEANGPIIGGGYAFAIYLGGEMNEVPETITYNGESVRTTTYQTVLPIHNGFDILAGYKWFFGQGGFGMRLYGEYIGLFHQIANAHTIALNYDLLFNWVKTKPFKFGMILGVNVGAHITDYHYQPASSSLGSIFGGNLGFRFVIYNKYAIEVLVNPKLAYHPPENLIYEDYYSVRGAFGSFMFTTVGNIRFVYTF